MLILTQSNNRGHFSTKVNWNNTSAEETAENGEDILDYACASKGYKPPGGHKINEKRNQLIRTEYLSDAFF